MAVKLLVCTLLILLGVCYGTADSNMHDHMDPASSVFFFLEDLKLGNSIPIYFPRREISDSLTNLLSKEEADSIPFTSQELDALLNRFSFSPDSPQAQAMRDTLAECDREPIKGEIKFCATSWESMSDFLLTIFGPGSLMNQVKPLFTTQVVRVSADSLLQKYTIVGIHRIPSPKMVSCHTMPYAYPVFYCHYQDTENRVYRVSLVGDNGDEVGAVAVCHMDTSEWGHNHVAFKILRIKPGSSPVCHFFPADHFVWVPRVG